MCPRSADQAGPPRFSVDTHLFRELGEHLVGRNSTALVELVKNSYDADATVVTVHSEGLDSPEDGLIILTDDGIGMNPTEFAEGFLRIASRTRDAGERRSFRFGRRYTGAKGIGRLAAHKLAHELRVVSVPGPKAKGQRRNLDGIEAVIEWDAIEAHETLDDVVDQPLIRHVESSPDDHGTAIELRRLRGGWTARQRDRFLREITSFTPPRALLEPLPPSIAGSALLFATPALRDSAKGDPGFEVNLSGDFERGDEFWPNVWDIAHWVIEIDSSSSGVRYVVTPTKLTRRENDQAETRAFERANTELDKGLHFQARIAVREGTVQSLPVETVRAHSGIRVFMEGFRVLPYGEPGNDWLNLDRDVARRLTGHLSLLTEEARLDAGEPVEKEGLSVLPNTHYHGAVFLTESGAGHLRMLVNREGFIPDATFETLVDLVRTGVDLSTRMRARIRTKKPDRSTRRQRRPSTSGRTPGTGEPTRTDELALTLKRVNQTLRTMQSDLQAGKVDEASELLRQVIPDAGWAAGVQEEAASEEAMLRVLASVGTQMSTVVHEMGGLATATADLVKTVRRLRSEKSVPKGALGRLERSLRDLQHSVERQAAYLVDIVSAEARRRRSKQRLAERFDAATRIIELIAKQRDLTIVNDIPKSARTPPMFPAELTSVFSNLLTNAVKAAGDGGVIRASGGRQGDEVVIRVENTGTAVDLSEAGRWFEAFESTTAEIHPVLGQGMGLGLTIVQRILEEYRASIAFVEPSPDFATAVEICFPA